jgi:hypothetical protein
MDKREILQKIIDDGGDCEALHARTQFYLCKTCPMSRLKQRTDGTYLSCWDSLITSSGESHLDDQKFAEDIYYAKALELLQDIIIEDMLTGDPSVKSP